MPDAILVRAVGLPEALATLDADTGSLLEAIVADELIGVEEALRGPDPRSPGLGSPAGAIDPRVGQSPLAPGSGLVPINTGRLLASFDARAVGSSAVLTADAQAPRSGFFYASEARFSGGFPGEVEELVSAEWEAFGERVAARFTAAVTAGLQ